MFHRDCNFPISNHFFLFGARGTGKSTLLRERFGTIILYFDLLNINTEREFARDPESLDAKIRAFQEQNKLLYFTRPEILKISDSSKNMLQNPKTRGFKSDNFLIFRRWCA